LKRIGRHFGIGEWAVSQASHRFEKNLEQERELRRKLLVIGEKTGLCKV
jgi:hypothetical protein